MSLIKYFSIKKQVLLALALEALLFAKSAEFVATEKSATAAKSTESTTMLVEFLELEGFGTGRQRSNLQKTTYYYLNILFIYIYYIF